MKVLELILQSLGPGAVIAGFFLVLLVITDESIGPGPKAWLSAKLHGLKVPEPDANQFSIFITMFDRVLGTQYLGWRFILGSFIASLGSVAFLIIIDEIINPDHLVSFVNDVNEFPTVFWIIIVPGPVGAKFIPDYLSLIETRWLLGKIDKGRYLPILLILIDIVFTFAIFALFSPTIRHGIDS
ncbi:MAG: hypothetical protein VCE74_16955 [Alphaproteobacteria bacterium]